ncbi:MAG TPA: NAD-dependent epimerase/dehydratase family protein, partial [Bacteroidia bacterium]|nr:NAD-dependent epimerase/dehydratase family protein [Bacteroidia bacterium]
MLLITGAAGFIGSCLLSELNRAGLENIVISDDFTNEEKNRNLMGKKFLQKVHRDELPAFIEVNKDKIEFVFHIGAKTDTTLFDVLTFDRLNLNYTKKIWDLCAAQNIPLVYASSAATYGLGEFGYDDEDESIIYKL